MFASFKLRVKIGIARGSRNDFQTKDVVSHFKMSLWTRRIISPGLDKKVEMEKSVDVPVTPKKEKVRIIKAFLVFTVHPNGHLDGKNINGNLDGKKIKAEIKFPTKISPQDEVELDPDSVAMMCFPDGIDGVTRRTSDGLDTVPDGIDTGQHERSWFHSFVITKQDGSRLYGSTLVVLANIEGNPTITHVSQVKSYCLLSTIPFVDPMHRLLKYFHESKCEPSSLVQRICNLKVPSKGKYLKLMLPPIPSHISSRTTSGNQRPREVFIYRGTSEYPIFDHPLRELFERVLSPGNFLLTLSAALLEYQILIISRDYNKLMMVSESLITLLHPFKWQHVYVPILPSKLGLHYLDAPTPYIMGLTSCPSGQANQESVGQANQESVGQTVSMTFHSLQCHVFCDEDRVEHVQGGSGNPWDSCFPNDGQNSIDSAGSGEEKSFLLPPFYHSLLEAINKILSIKVEAMLRNETSRNEVVSNVVKIRDNNIVAIEKVTKPMAPFHTNGSSGQETKPMPPFSGQETPRKKDDAYLEDLIFNQSVRMMFREMIQRSLLSNFEKFLVNSSSRNPNCSFDSVSYLIDQPGNSRKFLSRFFETQMFATFIDEVGSRRRLRKGSLFDLQFDTGVVAKKWSGRHCHHW